MGVGRGVGPGVVGPLWGEPGAQGRAGVFGGCVSRRGEARPVDRCWQGGAAVIEVGHRGSRWALVAGVWGAWRTSQGDGFQ